MTDFDVDVDNPKTRALLKGALMGTTVSLERIETYRERVKELLESPGLLPEEGLYLEEGLARWGDGSTDRGGMSVDAGLGDPTRFKTVLSYLDRRDPDKSHFDADFRLEIVRSHLGQAFRDALQALEDIFLGKGFFSEAEQTNALKRLKALKSDSIKNSFSNFWVDNGGVSDQFPPMWAAYCQTIDEYIKKWESLAAPAKMEAQRDRVMKYFDTRGIQRPDAGRLIELIHARRDELLKNLGEDCLPDELSGEPAQVVDRIRNRVGEIFGVEPIKGAVHFDLKVLSGTQQEGVIRLPEPELWTPDKRPLIGMLVAHEFAHTLQHTAGEKGRPSPYYGGIRGMGHCFWTLFWRGQWFK
ncbi:hypothetical protein IPG41_01165 [Candidatus Peregrinibacteria bacterium]|nr:MAG: hypothetical protein IPG41_01165 [Candidatus Peregrinibacteria bacterium]